MNYPSPVPPRRTRLAGCFILGITVIALMLISLVSAELFVVVNPDPIVAQVSPTANVVAVVQAVSPTHIAPTHVPTQPPAAVQPTQVSSTQATPTAKPACQAVNNNPWCYNFDATNGALILNPPTDFCGQYFDCIASFWNGHGYVIECRDGKYSLSGGRSGSCSRHGGDRQPLYSH